MDTLNLTQFVDSLPVKSLEQVVEAAQKEHRRVEGLIVRFGDPTAREASAREYQKQLSRLVCFLENKKKPDSMALEDQRIYTFISMKLFNQDDEHLTLLRALGIDPTDLSGENPLYPIPDRVVEATAQATIMRHGAGARPGVLRLAEKANLAGRVEEAAAWLRVADAICAMQSTKTA